MSKYIRNGETFRVMNDASIDARDNLPAGNYIIKVDDNGNFFLSVVGDFEQPAKLYGDTQKTANRIITTFTDRKNATGVLLSGEKGSGKTLLARTISISAASLGCPTLIINQPFSGDNFNKFIQDIDTPSVVLFDEFEKVYDQEEGEQEKILTLLDGVFPSKKLFIITCNDAWRIDSHLKNRPGRVFYNISFSGLTQEFIAEYCEDTLNNKTYVNAVCNMASMFDSFNFDMLKAVVEEMNRYNESPVEAVKLLNAKPGASSEIDFEVKLFVIDGAPLELERVQSADCIEINPTEPFFIWYYVPGAKRLPRARNSTGNTVKNSLYPIPVDDSEASERPKKYVRFTPEDIRKINGRNGEFVFVNPEGAELVIARKKAKHYSYYDAL